MTKQTMQRIAAVLEAAFGFTFDKYQADVWWTALRDHPDDAVERAVARLLQEWRPRFHGDHPYPADIISRLPGRLDPGAEAEAAWDRAVQSALHGPERYDPVTGTWPTGEDLDPTTLAAAGGPRGLRRIAEALEDQEDARWARREFLERYHRARQIEAANLLPGPEAGNHLRSMASRTSPRLLGAVFDEQD